FQKRRQLRLPLGQKKAINAVLQDVAPPAAGAHQIRAEWRSAHRTGELYWPSGHASMVSHVQSGVHWGSMAEQPLPVGKLPPELLARLLARAPVADPRVRLGPGAGLDCAVVDLVDRLLVFKTDPITFATAEIGWYLVQVNANDLATTGAVPRWLLLTM